MAGKEKSAKDSAMAAQMKAAGIKRNVCRCAICHRVVPLQSYPGHIRTCNGPKRKGK